MEWWFCEADKHLPENLVGTAELIFKCEHGCVESNSSLTRHDAWGHDRISVVIVTEINPSGRKDTALLQPLVCDLPGLRSSGSRRREQHINFVALLAGTALSGTLVTGLKNLSFWLSWDSYLQHNKTTPPPLPTLLDFIIIFSMLILHPMSVE